MYKDSLDKIVSSYFAAVTRERFTYKGTEYVPKPLTISPGIFRGYTCPPGCGGCCPRFSLVYLPGEAMAPETRPREVEFDGRSVLVFEDPQERGGHHCRYLRKTDGRCGIYERRPFSCDFELIRSSIHSDKVYLNTRLFGRGWAFLRVDGERGARCEITPPDAESLADVVRKLKRLHGWTEHFGLSTWLDTIIPWAERGPHDEPLYLDPRQVDIIELARRQHGSA